MRTLLLLSLLVHSLDAVQLKKIRQSPLLLNKDAAAVESVESVAGCEGTDSSSLGDMASVGADGAKSEAEAEALERILKPKADAEAEAETELEPATGPETESKQGGGMNPPATQPETEFDEATNAGTCIRASDNFDDRTNRRRSSLRQLHRKLSKQGGGTSARNRDQRIRPQPHQSPQKPEPVNPWEAREEQPAVTASARSEERQRLEREMAEKRRKERVDAQWEAELQAELQLQRKQGHITAHPLASTRTVLHT